MVFVVDEVTTGQVVSNVPVPLCHSHFTKTLCTFNYLSRTSRNINIHIKFTIIIINIIIIIIYTSNSSVSMDYNQKINTKETQEPCTTKVVVLPAKEAPSVPISMQLATLDTTINQSKRSLNVQSVAITPICFVGQTPEINHFFDLRRRKNRRSVGARQSSFN